MDAFKAFYILDRISQQPYNERKIFRDDIKGLTVSTVDSCDEGFETAILDMNGAHPVERYKSLKLAKNGHKKWCKKAESIKKVRKLGWDSVGLTDTKLITIERCEK